jgi:putative ABC transport system ATP-binding protein
LALFFKLSARTTALANVALPMIYAGYSKSERTARAAEVLEQVNG